MQALFAEKFCGECLGNAEQAAVAAGYSRTYARKNAYKLFGVPYVQKCILEYNKKAAAQEADTEPPETKYQIATIADIQAFWTDVMNDDEEMMKNRIRASELLAKAKGAFNSEW